MASGKSSTFTQTTLVLDHVPTLWNQPCTPALVGTLVMSGAIGYGHLKVLGIQSTRLRLYDNANGCCWGQTWHVTSMTWYKQQPTIQWAPHTRPMPWHTSGSEPSIVAKSPFSRLSLLNSKTSRKKIACWRRLVSRMTQYGIRISGRKRSLSNI